MDLSKLIELKQNNPDDIPLEIKNYKELCELLGEKIKSGNAKQKQLDLWKRYFSWTRYKFTYKITEIYNIPLSENILYEYKLNKFQKKYPNFCIPYADRFSQGIYKIVSNTQIYIGSTSNLFHRYYQHFTSNRNELTWKMLNENNAKFELIELFDGDLNLLRKKEQKYITDYIKKQKENPSLYSLKLINKDWTTLSQKSHYTHIRIDIKDKEKVVKILKENGIKIFNKKEDLEHEKIF